MTMKFAQLRLFQDSFTKIKISNQQQLSSSSFNICLDETLYRPE